MTAKMVEHSIGRRRYSAPNAILKIFLCIAVLQNRRRLTWRNIPMQYKCNFKIMLSYKEWLVKNFLLILVAILLISFCCPLQQVMAENEIQPTMMIGQDIYTAEQSRTASLQNKIITLEDLIGSAIHSHPSVKSLQALKNGMDAGVDIARWQFFPTPSITAQRVSASSDDTSYQGDDQVILMSLEQPLWTGGRMTALLDKAKADADIAERSVEAVIDTIALTVLKEYGNWMSGRLKKTAWEKSLDIHKKLIQQVGRRVESGFSANNDLFLAQGRLLTAQAEYEVASVQLDTALSHLEYLVGYAVTADMLDTGSSSAREIGMSMQENIVKAGVRSPEIKKACGQLKIARAEIDESKSNLWPTISLKAESQYGNSTYVDADPENRVFINVSSSFGAGLSSFSEVKAAQSKGDAALEEIEAVRRNISDQIVSDYTMMLSYKARIAALESSLFTSKRVFESYSRQFLAGRKQWLDIMNAARDLINVEVKLADALSSRMVVTWRLEIMTHGPLSILKKKDE